MIACGGDGTVSWILSEVDKLNNLNVPKVAILPLGTGNELSRTLGGKTTWDCSDNIEKFLKNVSKGKYIGIDR